LFFLFLLTGCAEIPPAAIGPPPTREQCAALVQQYIHKAFVDPYTVMDLSIETPRGSIWVIYFSSNSKNMMGGYTGIKRCKIILDHNNQINWPEQQLEIVRENDDMPI
jgi:hypothetical protein